MGMGGKWREWVYPRVCGGTPALDFCTRRYMGLSPRVRGNQAHEGLGAGQSGSIPACAGEPTDVGKDEARLTGLSPRVRGNQQPADYLGRFFRSIPRVCGGTFGAGMDTGSHRGLSPRVRGNQGQVIQVGE